MPERRFVSRVAPEVLRTDDGKPSRITGYAACYSRDGDPGTEYELYRGTGYRVVERLLPGCFDRAIKEDDVRALINHNPDQLLGRTSSGTCKLSVDATGLRYEIAPPDTQAARDCVESLKRGDMTGSSFAFDYLDKSTREVRGEDGDTVYLEVRAVKLYDVGPVTFPAYESTTAAARSLDQERLRQEIDAWRAGQERGRVEAKKRLMRARLLQMEQGR